MQTNQINTVGELIDWLKNFDKNLPVLINTEDRCGFRMLKKLNSPLSNPDCCQLTAELRDN